MAAMSSACAGRNESVTEIAPERLSAECLIGSKSVIRTGRLADRDCPGNRSTPEALRAGADRLDWADTSGVGWLLGYRRTAATRSRRTKTVKDSGLAGSHLTSPSAIQSWTTSFPVYGHAIHDARCRATVFSGSYATFGDAMKIECDARNRGGAAGGGCPAGA